MDREKSSPAERIISAIGRGADLLADVDYRLAETAEEKEEIYNLRYRAYLLEGAVKESAETRVTDRYDELPNAWTFGVYLRGQLCSSVRISVLTSEWRESTSTDVFPEVLMPRLDRGKVMIDPTRFVADPDQVKRVPEIPYLTTRLAYMACQYFNADFGLAIVRPEHQAFYRRVFLHETIAEPRLVPGLTKPFGLMAMDFPAVRLKVFQRYSIMRSTAFEQRMLFRRGLNRQEGGILGRQQAWWSLPFLPMDVEGPLAVAQGEMGVALASRPSLKAAPNVERETAEIIHRISKWAGSGEKARLWYRSEAIPAFGGRTAEALVREGRATEVRDFLDHVAMGGYA